MKKYLFLFVTVLVCMTSCNQTPSRESNQNSKSLEWKAEKAIYEEITYQIYHSEEHVVDGLVYMGVAKDKYEDGTVRYTMYTNFQKDYSNEYSLSNIKYTEEEIPVIIRFLDKCQSYNPENKEDIMQNLRYKGADGYSFVYSKEYEVIFVHDKDNNRYTWKESLSEIRNLFAGAKDRIETLKKEEK